MNARRRYETELDLELESGAAFLIEAAMGVTLDRCAPSKIFTWDFAVGHRDEFIGFLEIKMRSHASTTYPDLIISAAKINRGYELLNLLHIPASRLKLIVVAGLSDRLLWVDLAADGIIKNLTYSTGGRTDRNDKFDVETVAHIPIDTFKEFGGGGPCNTLRAKYLQLRASAAAGADTSREHLPLKSTDASSHLLSEVRMLARSTDIARLGKR